MAQALTAPFLLLAALLAFAGAAKLRAPRPAAGALMAVGVPGGLRGLSRAVRLAALGEMALGCAALIRPWPLLCGALAAVFSGFSLLVLALARRRAACGCFGSEDAPASAWQAVLNLLLAAVAALSVAWPPHGAGWLLTRWPAAGAVAAAGVLAAAYGVALAYSELPRAWSVWRGA